MLQLVKSLMFDWKWYPVLAALLVAGDMVLTAIITVKVPYTEIDWKAYMQEVDGFLHGELDYTKLRGDTGPLVYPAGFVYIFSGLYYATATEDGFGTNIALAQWMFYGVYIATLVTVLALYYTTRPSGLQPWVAALLCASHRIHSIFVLRLFNDCVAMLLLYLAVLVFCSGWRNKWVWGCVLFSLAVSVKMNVLLFAPGLLLLLLRAASVRRTVALLAVCAGVQLVLGLPFLVAHPLSYVSRAFEFSRVFTYKWTVNWKFLSEEAFVSKPVAVALLAGHLLLLAAFAWRWATGRAAAPARRPHADSAAYVAVVLFTSNFVGVAFARTLHYQFYCWYFHSLPLLLWGGTRLPTVVRLAVMAGIELAFNVFPATWWSSAVLQGCHGVLLVALLLNAGAATVVAPVKRD